MMLVRQLAHLNFGMPRVRSHGAPFVAARDETVEDEAIRKEAGTKEGEKGEGKKKAEEKAGQGRRFEIGIGLGKETGKAAGTFCLLLFFRSPGTPSIMTKYFN